MKMNRKRMFRRSTAALVLAASSVMVFGVDSAIDEPRRQLDDGAWEPVATEPSELVRRDRRHGVRARNAGLRHRRDRRLWCVRIQSDAKRGLKVDPWRHRPDRDDLEYKAHQRRVIADGREAMKRTSRPL
jgi:hypothetical protein